MKSLPLALALPAFLLLAGPAAAQLELPAVSPAAKVSQRVGLTDISVEYSSPAVKGRKIWGELVPFDKPWRTGANAATKITFSKDVSFGGKPVPAGTYTLFTLPTATGWTVVLSKDLGFVAGQRPYDEKTEVVRVPATTAEIPLRERMLFVFGNTTEDATSLDLEWEKLKVSVPIQVDTAAQAQANITAATEGAARTYAQAARYLAENTKEYDRALKLADTAVSLQPGWYAHWVRADILAKKGKYADARKAAQTAMDLGQKDPNFFAKDAVAKALEDWKGKK